MEDKNVPARRRRKLAPNKHHGPKSICQFNGGEGFHYSTFYTSSVICSYDCLSSSVWAGLGGGGGGGGGVVRRDAYSGICYGVCCCCAAAGWLGLAGWAGPPAAGCPPWLLLGLVLGSRCCLQNGG